MVPCGISTMPGHRPRPDFCGWKRGEEKNSTARALRFNFAVGPQKTAIVCFGPGRARSHAFLFRALLLRQVAQRQAARPLGLCEVENAVERRTRNAGGLRRLGPWLPEGSAGNCLLRCDRQHAPPATRPAARRGGAQGWRRFVGPQSDQVSHQLLRVAVEAPSDLAAKHQELLLPLAPELRVVAALRRSAARRAAPSTSAVHGCGCPVRVSGETSVASQHSVDPLGVAP